jgi:putative aldouronate transport system permease protein
MGAAEKDIQKGLWRMNRVKPATNFSFNILFILLAACSILPVIFVFMISVSSEASIRQVGYSFLPVEFSNRAYLFLWNERGMIFNSLFISVAVTCLGTLIGLILNTAMGYSLSRPAFRLKSFYTWVIFIPMLFGGGMVASYVVNANILNLRNTIWALILPLLGSSYNIVICKTFFKSTIPDGVIESAMIDGASQLRTYTSIVLPISKPLLATISLFMSFGYWNDWFQSSLYITKTTLVSLQALLNNMMRTLNYLANNPTAGLSLQQYRNQMPSESVRMAIAIVIVIPIACAYPFFQKYFISGLTIGAVKG